MVCRAATGVGQGGFSRVCAALFDRPGCECWPKLANNFRSSSIGPSQTHRTIKSHGPGQVRVRYRRESVGHHRPFACPPSNCAETGCARNEKNLYVRVYACQTGAPASTASILSCCAEGELRPPTNCAILSDSDSLIVPSAGRGERSRKNTHTETKQKQNRNKIMLSAGRLD